MSMCHSALSQQPDGTVVGAQQQKPLGGQNHQAGQSAAEVLRAQFGAADRALRDVSHGVHPNLVCHCSGHDLRSVEVKGVDGVRLRLVLTHRLVFQVFPHCEGVVSGGTNDHISLSCLFRKKNICSVNACHNTVRLYIKPVK